MATHSSVLAWRIPGTAEPGGLPSLGSHRVGHDWSDLATAAAAAVILRQSWLTFATVSRGRIIGQGSLLFAMMLNNISRAWPYFNILMQRKISLPSIILQSQSFVGIWGHLWYVLKKKKNSNFKVINCCPTHQDLWQSLGLPWLISEV